MPYKITKETKTEVLLKGIRPCPSCGKTAQFELVFEDGFTYLNGHCDYENKDLRIAVAKGRIDEDWERMPSSWPKLVINEIGDFSRGDDENVVNIQNVKVVFFYITNWCNAFCQICNAYEDTIRDMGLDFFRKKISKYKNKHIVLMGGEPSVREDLQEMISIINDSGNIAGIWTNGMKLADIEYVRALKTSGLEFLLFSFDGFQEEFYGDWRGNKESLRLKLRALDNLEAEGIETILNVTLIRGKNEREISPIIQFAKSRNSIKGIMFEPLYLYDQNANFGLSADSMLSKDEIIGKVCESLNTDTEIFDLWNDVRMKAALFLEKLFPWLPMSVFWRNEIYFLREKGELAPLFGIEDLRKIKKCLEGGIFKAFEGFLRLPFAVFLRLMHLTLYFNNERRLYSQNKLFKITAISLTKRVFAGDAPICAIGENENLKLRRKDAFILFQSTVN